MAALQSIRSKGTILIIVLGLALFAFIAEEFVRSIETTRNQSKQQIGKIYGEKLTAQEFQALIEEYTEAYKFMQGGASLSDEQQTQLKDQVWQTYVNDALIRHEAEKLGLTVTDEEVQTILKEGTNPLLMQTPFRNQQTGKFDLAGLQKFIKDYQSMAANTQIPAEQVEQYTAVYNYWKFVEKSLKSNLLGQKYQSLLGKAVIANTVIAQMAYNDATERNDIQLATLPYNAIPEEGLKPTEEEIKAKYEEKKDLFKQYIETRDIAYIDVPVVASQADKEQLAKEMDTYYNELVAAKNIANVVRSSNSAVPYADLLLSKNAFPQDISAQLDSIAVGTTKSPYYNAMDNSMNTIKMLTKTQAPDSIQYSQIQIGGQTLDAAKATADSIMNALNAGANFDSLANKYGQAGQKVWIASSNYEGSLIDADGAKLINAITTTATNGISNVQLLQGNIIIKVYDRRHMITKYNVAVIKRPVTFSKETYSKAYNEFNRFITENTTFESMKKNAVKRGYIINTQNDLSAAQHNVAGITGTKEVLRWIYDAKAGDLSQLYEVGSNDHLMIVSLTKVHEVGYRDLESVKDIVTGFVLNDKKAAKIQQDLAKGDAFVNATKLPYAQVDTLAGVTFATAPYVRATGANEPIIAGIVDGIKVGTSSTPLKGNAGVYVVKVNTRNQDKSVPYNAQQYMMQLTQYYLQSASTFMNELYLKANVMDKRYLYF